MTGDRLSTVLDPDGEATDSNGTSLRRYETHAFLSRYRQLLGVDSRGIVVYYDGENVQNALLDAEGSIASLTEGPLWGDSPAEHVVNVAEEYGRWRYLDPEVATLVEREFGDELDSLGGVDDEQVRFSSHARERWDERVGAPLDVPSLASRWVELDVAGWDESVRYDPETGAILVVDHPTVVTVFPRLASLEPAFRERVREALFDRGLFH